MAIEREVAGDIEGCPGVLDAEGATSRLMGVDEADGVELEDTREALPEAVGDEDGDSEAEMLIEELPGELLVEGVAEGELDAVEGCIEQSVAPGLSHVLPVLLFMKRPLLDKERPGDSAVA